jgi:fructose-1,6-bisphosphatase/inositol monophosphatase family enzyme
MENLSISLLLMQNDYSKLLNVMEIAAIEAARHIFQARKDPARIKVSVKPDNSIVMNLDVECQDIIRANLPKEIEVAAEEDVSSHSLVGQSKDYFSIDPIDGTASCKRFLHQEGGQIGFGPLIGLVVQGKLTAATYFNIPTKTLYSAMLNQGVYKQVILNADNARLLPLLERDKLKIMSKRKLSESGMLFFPGSESEFKVVLHLRANNLIENTYRLGGFANDCCRLAEDFEQLQIQCRVKAWDFSAALFPHEAGFSVVMDPFGTRVDFIQWKVSATNSVLAVQPENKAEILSILQNVI